MRVFSYSLSRALDEIYDSLLQGMPITLQSDGVVKLKIKHMKEALEQGHAVPRILRQKIQKNQFERVIHAVSHYQKMASIFAHHPQISAQDGLSKRDFDYCLKMLGTAKGLLAAPHAYNGTIEDSERDLPHDGHPLCLQAFEIMYSVCSLIISSQERQVLKGIGKHFEQMKMENASNIMGQD